MAKNDDYCQRAAKIMPVYTYWGSGVVLITHKEWLKANERLCSILNQLHKAKIKAKELTDGNRN